MNTHSLQDPSRRRMLAMVGGALGVLAFGNGAVFAADLLAAYPKKAFSAKKEDAAIQDIFDGKTAVASDKIKLTAPEIAANGAVVPIKVETSLPKVTRIAILVPKNPYTLAAQYIIPEGTEPYISNRIKMGQTSDVVALVESNGKLYSAKKSVKVTVGGCGG